MQYILEKRSGPSSLVHITTEDRLESIQRFGILPSVYGDMAVDGNDGAGIYAVYPDADAVKNVLRNFVGTSDAIIAIQFHYDGLFYECVDSIADEEEDGEDFHKGFLVIPHFDLKDRLQIPADAFEVILPVEAYLKNIKT